MGLHPVDKVTQYTLPVGYRIEGFPYTKNTEQTPLPDSNPLNQSYVVAIVQPCTFS